MRIETKKVAVAYCLFSLVVLSVAAQARMVDAEAGGPKEHERAMRDVAADHDHHNSETARSEAQKTFDSNTKIAEKISAEIAAAKEREAMRDKTHDGRPMIGKNMSLGVQTNPLGINVKISTDSPKKDQKSPR